MRNYTIPGISAKLVDYQLEAEQITTPGDIVIILCDLPDELTIPDPDKTGEFLVVPVPANVPILINQPSQLKSLITGDEVKNGIANSTGKDQHLAIVNILPLLKTEKPVAICKIVRRNGERPDVTINKELYEAMDYAYEHLGNYPAGAIVNAEIGYEDEAAAKTLEVLSQVYEFNGTLTNVEVTSLNEVENVSFKKEIIPGDLVKFTVTENMKEFNKSISIPLRTDNLIYSKYLQLKQLADDAKINSTPTIISPELIELVSETTAPTLVGRANLETGKVIHGNLTPIDLSVTTETNTYNFKLKVNPLDFNSIREDECLDIQSRDEILLSDFYLEDGVTFAFSNVPNPIAADSNLIVNSLNGSYVNQTFTYTKKGVKIVQLDRTFVTCEKYLMDLDSRIKEKVLINIDNTKNKFTSSALLTLEGYSNGKLVINGEEIEVEGFLVEAKKLMADCTFNYKGLLEITLLKDLDIDFDKIQYEISILPLGAAFDKRTVQFCHKLTTELNECVAYFGAKPPKTTSAKDIEEQVTKLYNLSMSKNYADTDLDKGLYIRVVAGSHKSGTYGGITNFPQTLVKAIDANKVTIDTSLILNIGDKLEISTVSKGKTLIEEFVVEDIVDVFNAQEIHLNKEVSLKIIASKTTKLLSLVNKKDVKGTYLAAMYACYANGFLDKAPMNAQLPGESEIFYTNKQLERLLDARITPINRKPFNTNGVIIDTPTMAMPTSDFEDQGTVGVVFHLIRQLRLICEPKKGKRYGDAAQQMLLQEELKAPFDSILGTYITDYKLEIDFAKLNRTNVLEVAFSVREAKKLKVVNITAKMF